MADYPRENCCSVCGTHIGWVLNPEGEVFALDACEDCAPMKDVDRAWQAVVEAVAELDPKDRPDAYKRVLEWAQELPAAMPEPEEDTE